MFFQFINCLIRSNLSVCCEKGPLFGVYSLKKYEILNGNLVFERSSEKNWEQAFWSQMPPVQVSQSFPVLKTFSKYLRQLIEFWTVANSVDWGSLNDVRKNCIPSANQKHSTLHFLRLDLSVRNNQFTSVQKRGKKENLILDLI